MTLYKVLQSLYPNFVETLIHNQEVYCDCHKLAASFITQQERIINILKNKIKHRP